MKVKRIHLFLLAMLPATGLALFMMVQGAMHEESPRRQRDEYNALPRNAENLEQAELNSSPSSSQAKQLQAELTQAIEQFHDLPFQPEYGHEIFDEGKKLNDTERQRWLRHCRFRDVYTSEHIRQPAFLEVYQLVQRYNLDSDIDKLCYLYNISSSLTSVVLHTTDYSPELVSQARQDELQDLLQEAITDYRRIIANIYKVDVEDEFMRALMEIKHSGSISDPNTHIDSGERIILN